MLILNGAISRGGVPAITVETGQSAGFTSVCICASLLLVPHLAPSQCVGRVLSEERDHMAAGGSQGGVHRGRDAEFNHRPAAEGRREGQV